MELPEWVFQLAEWTIRPQVVIGFCVLIVAFAFVVWCRLVFQRRKLERALTKAEEEISKLHGIRGFCEHFEAYSDKIRHIPQLKALWREFEETLILPEPGAAPKIRNAVDVSYFFNEKTLVVRNINVGWYQSVPNLLTGMGILGTFLGLAAGVLVANSGLASGNPDMMLGSLQQLLAGAALAFFTSITGLTCSMLFRWREASIWKRLSTTVDAWAESVDARLVRVTPESIGLEQLKQAKEAASELKTFNNELIFSLEKALEEGIAARVSKGMDSLIAVVRDLRKDRQTDADQMVSHALGELTTSLKGQTESQFKEMAGIVNSLNQALMQSTEGFSKMQSEMRGVLADVLESTSEAMKERSTAMTDTLLQSMAEMRQTVAESVRAQVEHMTSSTKVVADELEARLATVIGELSQAGINAALKVSQSTSSLQAAASSLSAAAERSETVLSSMTSFTDQLNHLRTTILTAQRQVISVSTPLEAAAVKIQESSEASTESVKLAQAVVDRMSSVVMSLSEQQDRIADVWQHYQNRFEGVDQALAAVFHQLDGGLAKYCEQVRLFVTELDNVTAHTVGKLAGACGELNQSIEDLTDVLGNGTTSPGDG